MKKLVGYTLLGIPFIILVWGIVKIEIFRLAMIVAGIGVLITGLLITGIFLLNQEFDTSSKSLCERRGTTNPDEAEKNAKK